MMRYLLQHTISAVNSDAAKQVDELQIQMKEITGTKPDMDRANERSRAQEMDRVQHALELARAKLVGIQLLSDEIAAVVLGEPVPDRAQEEQIGMTVDPEREPRARKRW